jgi:hypothetical protein
MREPVTDFVMDLWQEPIPIARPDGSRRHLPAHPCAAPEVEFGEFVPPLFPGPPTPDFLDHIVLVDPQENYTEDYFVANFIGGRGDAHPVGNLVLRWNAENVNPTRTVCSVEIKVWA